MKSFKILATVLMLASATTTSAQFVNSGSNTTTSSGSRNVDLTGWNRITISYNPTTITMDYKGSEDLKMNGFSIGYAKGFNIAKQIPLFLETGVNAQFATKKLDSEEIEDTGLGTSSIGGYEVECKFTSMNLNIPINLAYKFTFNNGNTSLVPYAGVNIKFNVIGKSKYNLSGELDETRYENEDEFWEYIEENNEDVKQNSNMFDKKDVGKDYQWKRFQMGWQIGLGLYHNQFYVGVGYTKDFTELFKKAKVGYANISVGYSF